MTDAQIMIKVFQLLDDIYLDSQFRAGVEEQNDRTIDWFELVILDFVSGTDWLFTIYSEHPEGEDQTVFFAKTTTKSDYEDISMIEWFKEIREIDQNYKKKALIEEVSE